MNDRIHGVWRWLAGAAVALAVVAIVFLFNILSNSIGQTNPETPDADAPSSFVIDEESDLSASSEQNAQLTGNQASSEQGDEPITNDTHPEEPEITDNDNDEPPLDDTPTDEQPEPIELSVANVSESDSGLTDILDGIARDFNCVSVSLAFFDGASEYRTYQYGFADISARRYVEEETKFRIASLGKFVVVILAMTLVEEGKLDLDTDISEYLGYEARNPFFPETPITSRMLMQHTSSIYDDGAFQSGRRAYEADTTRTLLNMSTAHRERQPGTLHEYSDFAYAVLAAVCEGVSGKLLDELAAEALFEPMGIDAAFAAGNLNNKNLATLYNSSHSQTRSVQTQLNQGASNELGHQHNLAIGNLTISALDYAKILKMLTDGGVYDGVRVLSEASVREIHNTDVAAEYYQQGLSTRFQDKAFMGKGVYWHTGSAYGIFTQFMYCLDTGKVVVVITTGTSGAREPNGMIKACLALSEPVWG